MIGTDSYYDKPEVSNSDLSEMQNYFMPKEYVMDLRDAYRFGNLIDAMLTEPHRVDFFKRQVDGESFTAAEWDLAMKMRDAGKKDPMTAQMMKLCSGQAVKTKLVEFDYHGFRFKLLMRCKFDFWGDRIGWGADLKSTTATSLKQFIDACYHFNYDRQRAVYMKIADSPRDMLIGISKKNLKVFHLPITRGDDFHRSGEEKLTELAFKYWMLYGDLNQ